MSPNHHIEVDTAVECRTVTISRSKRVSDLSSFLKRVGAVRLLKCSFAYYCQEPWYWKIPD